MPVCALIKALKLTRMRKYRWRYTAEWRGTGAQSEHQCSWAYATHNKWWAAPTNNKCDQDIYGKCDATCLFQDNMLAVYMKIVWMHGLKKKWWLKRVHWVLSVPSQGPVQTVLMPLWNTSLPAVSGHQRMFICCIYTEHPTVSALDKSDFSLFGGRPMTDLSG